MGLRARVRLTSRGSRRAGIDRVAALAPQLLMLRAVMRSDYRLRGLLALVLGLAILASPSGKLAVLLTAAFAALVLVDASLYAARASKEPWTDGVVGLAIASVAVFAATAGFAWVVAVQALVVSSVMLALARKNGAVAVEA